MALKMDINFNEEKELLEIYPEGEIDIYTSPSFKEEVTENFQKHRKDIVLDGEKLDYIDSTGLGVLISIYKLVKEEEKDVYIENIKPNIRKLFDITDLDKIFIIK